MANIDSRLNVQRVRESQKKADHINLTLPKGTIERVQRLGYKAPTFIRELTLAEIEKLERMKN